MRFIKEMNNRYQISLILYTFCFLFAPPIIPKINFVIILAIYSFFVIIFKYSNKLKEFIKIYETKKLIKILLIYIIIYILSIICNYIFTKQFYLGNYIICSYSLFLCFPITFVCSLYIIFKAEEFKYDTKQIIMLFVKAGIIQAILALTALLFQPIKAIFIYIMYLNTEQELLLSDWLTSRRFYGFSNSMLDLFGLGTGIIATLPLFCSTKKGNKYILLIPILLLVPILNSRTGIVIFFIGIFLWMVQFIKNNSIKRVIFYFAIINIIFFFIVFICYIFSPDTIDWIIRDFSSFIVPNGGTASTLFSRQFWTIPDIQNLLIGTSHNIFEYANFAEVSGPHSDVGYINELWKTGIIGSFLIYYAFYYMLKQVYNNKNKLLSIFLGLSIAVFLLKGSIITYNTGCAIIVTLSLFSIQINNQIRLQQNKFKKVEKIVNNNNHLVSIIVPIYNVEKYLEKCINSILNQTYKNIEVILVNDGSKDNSGNICEIYAKNDNRIKVIHKENGGLSDARNYGIKASSGKYLCFVDSDDYISNNFVELLLKNLLITDSDICACNFYYVDEDNKIWKHRELEYKVYNKSEGIFDILTENQNTSIMVWNKLYKADLFKKNHILFDVGKIHEDTFIMYKLYDKSKKICLIENHLYYYLQRKGSIMSQKFNKRSFDMLTALDETREYFKNKKEYSVLIDCYTCIIYLTLINRMIRFNYDGNEKEKIINYLINEKTKYFKNPLISIKTKLKLFILIKNEKIYHKLLKIYEKV